MFNLNILIWKSENPYSNFSEKNFILLGLDKMYCLEKLNLSNNRLKRVSSLLQMSAKKSSRY